MADKIVEKRKFMWRITNFTREKVNKYERRKRVDSEAFEIKLGENNTTWYFYFYPKSEEEYWGFYIYKLAVDRDDFLIKLSVDVQKSDTTARNLYLEKNSNAFQVGQGRGWDKIMLIDDMFKEENKYLSNDTLTFIINLELRQELPPAKTHQCCSNSKMNANYFKSMELNDISIICSDEKKILAHRYILADRSPIFKTMLTIDMVEKKSNKIIVEDTDFDTMQELMRYIYTGEVQNLKEHASKLLDCAEKYDIPGLKIICVDELIEQLSEENVFEYLMRANLYREQKLMNECMDYIDTNFANLKESEGWKKLDINLIISTVDHMRKNIKRITTFTNSL